MNRSGFAVQPGHRLPRPGGCGNPAGECVKKDRGLRDRGFERVNGKPGTARCPGRFEFGTEIGLEILGQRRSVIAERQ